YRKIHLYDALGEQESAVVAPGAQPVVADLCGVRVGIMTCYDVRFPELARALAVRGAELIVLPAAWATGLFKEEHWVTLVLARAASRPDPRSSASPGGDPRNPAGLAALVTPSRGPRPRRPMVSGSARARGPGARPRCSRRTRHR